MSARVRVRHHHGRLAAVKVGVDPHRDVELVREAAMLTAARHPGVVSLLALAHGPDGLELITGWVGTRSLGDTLRLAPSEAAGVVGALAATVADLHRHGIVHGSIDPSHVLLDDRGRPVLCSFAHAALIGTNASAEVRPSDDVAALGELLAEIVGAPDDPELVPTRRFGRRQDHHLHRSILTIADHARADDRASRPSAASLAAALAELAPAASLPAEVGTPPAPSPDSEVPDRGLDAQLDRLRASAATVPDRRPRWPRWPFVTGVVAMGMLVIGVVGIVNGGTPSRAETVELARTPPSTGAPPTTRAPAPPAPSTTTTGAPMAAPVIELATGRYQVGEAGDQAVVAPWRCDDQPRVVLLRPGTGELFLFESAPAPGGDTVASPFGTVQGATTIASVDPRDPCPDLVVLRADRSAVPVDLPAGR